MDYKNAYLDLFRAITQVVNELEKSFLVSKEVTTAIDMLKMAQQATEDMYISDQK